MKWDPSHAFAMLLVSQLALHLVYPLVGQIPIAHLLGIFLIVALYGGIRVTVRKPLKLWLSVIMGLCFVGFYWAAILTGVGVFYLLGSLFGAVFFGFIAAIMMNYIFFYRSKVNVYLIYGAISIYLLIGSVFTQIYITLALAFPGAFNGVDAGVGYDQLSSSLSYYSFVTLTTLGYGDITPQLHYARVLAYVEAVFGQLYLTILVARLVGTHIAQSQRDSS